MIFKAMSSKSQTTLTEEQKARIEQNKKKALLLKKARVTKRPHEEGPSSDIESKIHWTPLEIDTRAGFFLEDVDTKTTKTDSIKIIHEPGPLIESNLVCEECQMKFQDSYLYNKFDQPVCDSCRDDEKHSLITRTDAKSNYLLKDEDFDKREPPLKYILRKNPHNPKWGDMKLYLQSQIWKRVMEVWGSEEKLEEAREERAAKKEKTKQKKYDKKLKELRMSVRSSLWRKDLSGHQHEYGDEVYDEDKDSYSKTCSSCGHEWTYEKM
ncbi:DNA repair protein complementing XP-A cells homolog [Physella acuta]|uniref:DNA repair protein complementing XP-A cells homolog n=1 Tax=Physella acuta TaxID=109671 RepID=UPI0027DD9AFC|nr:DNA repair protein complementing XP-A cells homolog [Physella acuta]XP_059160135.1 DNA repair protein complementing XP-A cells homolog [Physella acuta]XP_059160136.1 DNA repair protein complementing XP-A cells homolog [Physella acuta]